MRNDLKKIWIAAATVAATFVLIAALRLALAPAADAPSPAAATLYAPGHAGDTAAAQPVTSPPLPLRMTFAGEEVPLHYIDVREKLDRELSITMYRHAATSLIIKRSYRYLPEIRAELARRGLPEDLAYLPVVESDLMNAVSPSKATGFWQFLEGTGKDHGLEITREVDERYHWRKSTQAACSFLLWLRERCGSWALTAAAYNCGYTAARRQADIQGTDDYYSLLLPAETERYLFRLLAYKLVMENPALYGFQIEPAERYPAVATRGEEVSRSIPDLALWAAQRGLSYAELKRFNPWLRDTKLTVRRGRSYVIDLPEKNYRGQAR